MKRPPRSLPVLWCACLLFLSAGCGPTYPKEKLAESLIQLTKEEYGVDISVKIVGKTLGVYVPLEKLFDSTLQLSPEVGDKLDGVILSTSRVVLSTDMPLDFYVVVAQDKRIPGVELRLVRYIQDIRRLNYQNISRGEFTKRMLFEFGMDLGIFQESRQSFNLEEVKLEQFLARQMATRIKMKLEGDEVLQDVTVETVRGEFAEEPRRFVITLQAEKQGLRRWGSSGGGAEKRILETTFEVIMKVLREYRFQDFGSIEIKAPFLGHAFVLNREVLELYRNKEITLTDLLLPNDFNLSPHDAELLLKQ